jgi:hypothetical protein
MECPLESPAAGHDCGSLCAGAAILAARRADAGAEAASMTAPQTALAGADRRRGRCRNAEHQRRACEESSSRASLPMTRSSRGLDQPASHADELRAAARRRRAVAGRRTATAGRRALRGEGQYRRRGPRDDGGLPAFAYRPRIGDVIERLIAAGAICVGKTNLDQFATGLNGTRSPYGIPRNAYNLAYVSGGSSSGSSVAVAAGWSPSRSAPTLRDRAACPPPSIT